MPCRGIEMKERLEHYGLLSIGDSCPKCKMGQGLREAYPLEVGWTGWENYKWLHCDICGAFYVGKGVDYIYMRHAKPITSDENI